MCGSKKVSDDTISVNASNLWRFSSSKSLFVSSSKNALTVTSLFSLNMRQICNSFESALSKKSAVKTFITARVKQLAAVFFE